MTCFRRKLSVLYFLRMKTAKEEQETHSRVRYYGFKLHEMDQLCLIQLLTKQNRKIDLE